MVESFNNYLKLNIPDIAGKKILLAISGGSDSVALLHLLKSTDVQIYLAHANFQLRGAESEEDALFVKELALKHNLPLFYKVFKIKKADSVQEKARELRYDWFQSLAAENNFDFVATAHHRDDQIETFFLNLFRGSGVKGLAAMPFALKNHIRPLLIFTKKDIDTYIKKNKIKYREDSSNSSDKYNRNYIRHHITPAIEKFNPSNLPAIIQSIDHIQSTYHYIQSSVEIFKNAILEIKNNQLIINKSKLLNFSGHLFLLHYFLEEYNFAAGQTDEFLKLMEAKNGKKINSHTHTIIKNKEDELLLLKNEEVLQNTQHTFELNFQRKRQSIDAPLKIKILLLKQNEVKNFKQKHTEILVDKNTIEGNHFTVKTVHVKDVFTPFGSKQKMNVLAFLKNQKIPLHQRLNSLVLKNNNKIVWVVGIRMAAQFACSKATENIIQFQLIE